MERTGVADGTDKILWEEKEQLTAENGKVTGEKYTKEKRLGWNEVSGDRCKLEIDSGN
jgi:hypothetical protein